MRSTGLFAELKLNRRSYGIAQSIAQLGISNNTVEAITSGLYRIFHADSQNQ